MPPHVLECTKVEYDSKLHIVRGLSVDPDVFEGFDTADNFIGARGIPRAGTIGAGVSFEDELRGGSLGAGAKTPPNGALLKACGLKETISTTVSATYAWTGTFPTDVTAVDLSFFYGDAFKKVCTSSVGDLTLTLIPGQPCICSYNFIGLYAAATEASHAAALEVTANAPICKALALSIGGVSAGLTIPRCVISLNNSLTPNPGLTGTAGMHAPNISGSRVTMVADIQTTALATWNSETRWTAGTKAAFSCVLGATAGNIMTMTGDFYPLAGPRRSSQGGNLMDTVAFAQSEVIASDTRFNIVYT